MMPGQNTLPAPTVFLSAFQSFGVIISDYAAKCQGVRLRSNQDLSQNNSLHGITPRFTHGVSCFLLINPVGCEYRNLMPSAFANSIQLLF